MQRVLELISEIVTKNPEDRFFDMFESRLQTFPLMRTHYLAYEKAFNTLEEDCWKLLKLKAISHFKDHRKGQLKQGFFNQLNEAFAYQYLVGCGCTDVRLIPEDGSIKPDISYSTQGCLKSCEVKTICISEDEITCRSISKYTDRSHYKKVSSEFIQKLEKTLNVAYNQITSQGRNGLVFVIINFDDFTLTNYPKYRKQIVATLQNHKAPDIFVKIGILGRKNIYKQA